MGKMKKLINLTMFDLLKGVAIIGVVFGHSFMMETNAVLNPWFRKILHSLLMPSFFVVSGYWLKKKKVKIGLKTSVDYLLKPYILVILIIDGIGLIHRWLQGNLREWLDVFLIPSILVFTKGANRIVPMWFVFALFLAWCLFYVVLNIKNEKLHYVAAVASAVVGGVLLAWKLPFQIAQGLIAFFYVYCGYLLKKKKLLDAKIHPFIYILLVVGWGLALVFGSMDLYSYNVKYGIFSILGSLCGAFLFIRMFLYLNLLEWRILDGIRWIGRHSMWIVCLHAVEYAVIPWRVLFQFVQQGAFQRTLVYFIMRMIWIIIMCLCLLKIHVFRIKKKAQKRIHLKKNEEMTN